MGLRENRLEKAAAVQLDTRIADSAANIGSCRRLALEAVAEGARWIAVPEFFNTGMAWDRRLAKAVETERGPAATFLREFSAEHGVVIGGSFLCRIPGGAVRNRYMAFAGGRLIGIHDKDLPTMWENAFYEGGDPGDTGFLGEHDGCRVGAAVCWEFMRTMTARRLKGRVDVVLGGSCWWSIPDIVPGPIRRSWEEGNALNSIACVQDTARLTGAPVVHASHCARVRCPMLGVPPLEYRGRFEGRAAIVDRAGKVLAMREPGEGEGVVCADIVIGSIPVAGEVPGRFWLRNRGFLPAVAWHGQRHRGRIWYRLNMG
jgi:predicted amidohydrolase